MEITVCDETAPFEKYVSVMKEWTENRQIRRDRKKVIDKSTETESRRGEEDVGSDLWWVRSYNWLYSFFCGQKNILELDNDDTNILNLVNVLKKTTKLFALKRQTLWYVNYISIN